MDEEPLSPALLPDESTEADLSLRSVWTRRVQKRRDRKKQEKEKALEAEVEVSKDEVKEEGPREETLEPGDKADDEKIAVSEALEQPAEQPAGGGEPRPDAADASALQAENAPGAAATASSADSVPAVESHASAAADAPADQSQAVADGDGDTADTKATPQRPLGTNDKLQRALQALRERREELHEAHADLDAARAENEALWEQVREVREEMDVERTARKAEVAKSSERIAALEASLKAGAAELDQVRAAAETAGSELAKARSRIAELEESGRKARRQVAELEETGKVLRTNLGATQEELASERASRKTLEAMRASNEDGTPVGDEQMLAQLEELRTELEKKEASRIKLVGDCSELRKTTSSLLQGTQFLQEKLDAERKEKEKQKDSAKSCQAQLSAVESERDDLRKSKASLWDDNKVMQTQSGVLRKELDEARASHKEFSEAMSAKLKELRDVKETVNNSRHHAESIMQAVLEANGEAPPAVQGQLKVLLEQLRSAPQTENQDPRTEPAPVGAHPPVGDNGREAHRKERKRRKHEGAGEAGEKMPKKARSKHGDGSSKRERKAAAAAAAISVAAAPAEGAGLPVQVVGELPQPGAPVAVAGNAADAGTISTDIQQTAAEPQGEAVVPQNIVPPERRMKELKEKLKEKKEKRKRESAND